MNETVSLNDTLLNLNDTLIPLSETPEDESRSIWIYGIAFSFVLASAFILIFCRLCKRKSKKGTNLTVEDVERGELLMKKNVQTEPRRQDIKNEPQQEQEEALNVGDARETLDNPEISSLSIKGDSIYYRGVDDSFMSIDSSHRPPPLFNYSVTSDIYETAPLNPPILDETKEANVSLLNAFSRMAIGDRSDTPSQIPKISFDQRPISPFDAHSLGGFTSEQNVTSEQKEVPFTAKQNNVPVKPEQREVRVKLEQNDVFITPEQSDVQVTTEQCDVRVTPEKAAIPSSLTPTTPKTRKSPRNRCPRLREDLGEYAVYDYDEDGLPIFVTVCTKPEVPESKTRRKSPAAATPKTFESKTRRKPQAGATPKTPEPKTPERKTRQKSQAPTSKTPEPKTPESKTRRKPPASTSKTPESVPASKSQPLRSRTLETIAEIKSQRAAEGQRIPRQSKKSIGSDAE
uniref:Uncharacterized protein n=1 Tax=Panagrolaimus sp. PS1159 TaxID=55785 RepID=A0AC35FKB8_9BILA